MKIDLLCPVENQGVEIKTNSETGEHYALFKMFNLSEKVIERVVFNVRVHDEFGGEVGVIPAEFSNVDGQPRSFFGTSKVVSLVDLSATQHITTEFLEVHFAEGEPYIKTEDITDVTITEPDDEEKIYLMSAAGDDAICYAKDMGTYWVCVCGRANKNEAEECVRCGREKNEIMTMYASKESISKTLAEKEEKQRAEEEAKREAEEKARAERKAKIKKIAFVSAISLVALAIFCAIVVFVYGVLMTIMGNHAAKTGDFLTAYSRYAAVNKSEKIATVSEEVRGNSNSNLKMLGMMTADEENIYYLDPSYALYKENKATGERTRLGDANGALLNVMDGWLYYLDVYTGQALHRISTDGLIKEEVFKAAEDSYFADFMLIGNELFFVLQEPQKDLTPAMQEEIATGQASPYISRLYKMNVGSKKAKLIADAKSNQILYHRDQFYFVDDYEGAIYTMDRFGNNVKKLVSGPVYGVELNGDFMYYLDGTINETTGMPKFSLVKAQLDGTYIEDVTDGAMVIAFALDGDNLYYIIYNDDGNTILYKKNSSEMVAIAENCQQFNVKDGYLLYVDREGHLFKTNRDKTGFEEIVFTEEAAEPESDETPLAE